MKVFVYFNLHTKKWSIKALEGMYKGKVVAHATSVALSSVTMKVSEAGRQRVLKEKRKNVHAGLVGDLEAVHNAYWRYPVSVYVGAITGGQDITDGQKITYNPYRAPMFHHVDDWTVAVVGAEFVEMLGRTVYAWNTTDAAMDSINQLSLSSI